MKLQYVQKSAGPDDLWRSRPGISHDPIIGLVDGPLTRGLCSGAPESPAAPFLRQERRHRASNFLPMSVGSQLIEVLKQHVLATMRLVADCQPGGEGRGNVEIEQLCDLALYLPSQDHYVTYSLLCALIQEGVVERIDDPATPRRPRYRLTDAS